jgi:hypothetical protein
MTLETLQIIIVVVLAGDTDGLKFLMVFAEVWNDANIS